jgi:hypothetical protein
MTSAAAGSPGGPGSHLVPIGQTGWNAWRWAILRSAGFAIDGLDRLAAPECAEAADELLKGDCGLAASRFDSQFATATEAVAEAICDIAADPAFITALTWQNPRAVGWIEGAATTVTGAKARSGQRNYDTRRREEIIAKYWQRYCAKNDSVGFFGPVCWVPIDPAAPPVRGAHGPRLVKGSQVCFERWALLALAERIAADPQVRPSLPVTLQAGDTLADGCLLRPARPPQALSDAEAALLSLCDGRRPASDLAIELVATRRAGFRQAADVYAFIGRCAERGLLRWNIDLPMDLGAEAALRGHLQRIADPRARADAVARLDRLCAARDAVAGATGPAGLRAALATLDAEFTKVTGRAPGRRAGEVYAGRTLCHLDAIRDLDLVIGGAVIAKLAPLEPLLLAARWLTAEVAAAFCAELGRLYRDLCGDDPEGSEVPFARLWFLALGPLLGSGAVPEKVTDEFLARWSHVLGLDPVSETASRLDLTAADLNQRVRQAFPASAPGWAVARIHTPDVHLCAPTAEAARRGEFSLVLGELHIGFAGFDTQFFALAHPAPGGLAQAMLADITVSQVRPLSPDDWPRLSARNAEAMIGPDDIQLGFAPAAGADTARLVPVTSLVAFADAGKLTVKAPDGRTWPAVELFASLLGQRVFDSWKLVGGSRHTPRVSVDGMVILREAWRMTVADTALADAIGERSQYLAVRRWRHELGLPERVFILVGTEAKPCYLDLSSPVYTRILCGLLRAAGREGGQATSVTITELLPDAGQAWLTDQSGASYSSELRLQIRDPAVANP